MLKKWVLCTRLCWAVLLHSTSCILWFQRIDCHSHFQYHFERLQRHFKFKFGLRMIWTQFTQWLVAKAAQYSLCRAAARFEQRYFIHRDQPSNNALPIISSLWILLSFCQFAHCSIYCVSSAFRGIQEYNSLTYSQLSGSFGRQSEPPPLFTCFGRPVRRWPLLDQLKRSFSSV